MAKRPVAKYEEESRELSQWRTGGKRPGEPRAELPASLKRGKVDREAHLNAEVVRRARPEEVPISLQLASAMTPDVRAKWLQKALGGVARAASRPSDLFDVIVHPRFAQGVSGPLAKKMMEDLLRNVELFPEKPREVLTSGKFPLAQAAAAAQFPEQPQKVVEGAAAEIMSRCVDFIRSNERVLVTVHEKDARTFQVELSRSSQKEVWGLTWAREPFMKQQRVLEGIVPGTPAGRCNSDRMAAGLRPMQPGDVLLAVNGHTDWEGMGCIRDTCQASMVFCRAQELEDIEAPKSEGEAPAPSLSPPLFSLGGYTADETGSGWSAHNSGEWLYNASEGVYFHLASGELFLADPEAPNAFHKVGGSSQISADLPVAVAEKLAPSTSRGRLRWFSRAKGFGFIIPWKVSGVADKGEQEDIFLHSSQLEEPDPDPTNPPPLLLPGCPIEYTLGVQDDGKPWAERASVQKDLGCLCGAGFSTGSTARPVEKTLVEVKLAANRTSVAAFVGLASGRRGVGGAEYVALNLAKDLASSLLGREQAGDRGIRAALQAGFRQTQHGFLQYANRLSKNSASLWLSAETVACASLIYGPGADGKPQVLFTTVGGGRALIVRKDGSISAALGQLGQASSATTTSATPTQDVLKVFERGLKGPAIAFPKFSELGPHLVQPKGFGAHAWSEKDGASAGLELEIFSRELDWLQDALLVMGSDAFFSAFPDDSQVGQVAAAAWQALGVVADQPAALDTASSRVASQLVEVARRSKKKLPEDGAVAVLRLAWSDAPSGVTWTPAQISTNPMAPAQGFKEIDDIFADQTKEEEERVAVAEERRSPEAANVHEQGKALQAAVIDVEDQEEESEESSNDPKDAAQEDPPQAAPAEADREPAGELDLAFEDFCKELDGMRP